MPLTTVPAVEIARVGTWHTSTGDWDCTPSQIEDAVRAQHDPSFAPPIVKLGHTDPRFNGDGEPALGTIRNLRASEDGQALIGDLTDVPEWLAEVMAGAYPRRSVEAELAVITPDGQAYAMVTTGLALLGVTAPAVGSLADVPRLLGVTPSADEPGYVAARRVAATIGEPMPASDVRPGAVRYATLTNGSPSRPVEVNGQHVRPVRVTASAPLDGIWPAFDAWARTDGALGQDVYIDELGTDYLMVESWAVDDVVWRVPWTEANGAFTLGPAQRGTMEFQPGKIAAASGDTPTGHALPSARGRGNRDGSPREDTPTLADITPKMRELLGVADDATDEAVEAALQALSEKAATPAQAPPTLDPALPVPGDQQQSPPDQPAALDALVAEKVAAALAPRDEIIRDLSGQLATRNARDAADTRSQVIKAALDDGKITPAQLETWEARYDKAPDVTTEILASLAAGSAMPVRAAGSTGTPGLDGLDDIDRLMQAAGWVDADGKAVTRG
jgi:hypothetical protein